jgi:hypothetical protein
MAYNLADDNGTIDQIASVGGMNDLLTFVQRLRVSGPLSDFINTGQTSDVQGVITEIGLIVPYCTDPSVKDTLLNLKESLGAVKGTAHIID